jgi:predicted TIM-barrel fold metal-dependent hydrolase
LFPESLQRKYQPVAARLRDVGAERIRLMDAAGIDLQVLSHVQPGIQVLADEQAELAVTVSREVNDSLAEAVAAHPARFAGFAVLPTQSPAHAAEELARAVGDLGFKGALINGHTNGRYLDDPSFDVLLGRAESLGVPIYIHPTDPPQAVTDCYYAPFDPALVPTWGWPVETGTHLLRLICAGVFDRHRHDDGRVVAFSRGGRPADAQHCGLLPARKRFHHQQRRFRSTGVRLCPSDVGPRQPDVFCRPSIPGQLRRDGIP